MPEAALIGAFLAGLLGGVHCVAMCGGWIATTATTPAQAPMRPLRDLRLALWATQAGRLSTYVALGALLGGAGGAAIAFSIAPVQRVLYFVANLLLLGLAVSIAVRGIEIPALERAGLGVFRKLLPLAVRRMPDAGFRSRYLLGLAWGFTPCALVYGVLPVALLAGSAANGALVMLAFGLGTLPNLLAAAWTFARSPRIFGSARYRVTAALVVAAFALAGLYRVWFVPEALGQGPFCITG